MKVIIIWCLTLFFFLLSQILKRRVNFCISFFLVIGITFFSMLTPNGKILFSIGNFNFTQGALLDGLYRSGMLLMISFLSKVLVASNIKFPGKFGSFLNDVFSIYEKLSSIKFIKEENINIPLKSSNKEKFNSIFQNLINQIDEKLIFIWNHL